MNKIQSSECGSGYRRDCAYKDTCFFRNRGEKVGDEVSEYTKKCAISPIKTVKQAIKTLQGRDQSSVSHEELELCQGTPDKFFTPDKEVSYVPKQTMHQVNSFDCPNVSFDYTPIRNQKRSGAWAGSSQDEHEGGIRECNIVLEDISRSQQGDFQTQEIDENRSDKSDNEIKIKTRLRKPSRKQKEADEVSKETVKLKSAKTNKKIVGSGKEDECIERCESVDPRNGEKTTKEGQSEKDKGDKESCCEVIRKMKDEERNKLKETLNKKIQTLQDEITQLKSKKDVHGDKIQQQKSEMKIMKEEKMRLCEDKKAEECKVKALTKEKSEFLAAHEKLQKTIYDLQESKTRLETDIRGYVHEIEIHMQVNEKLRNEIEENEELKQELKQLRIATEPMNENEALQMVVCKDAQTATEDTSKSSETEDKVLGEIQELRNENLSLKEGQKIKDKEILSLKSQINEYKNRLENVLSTSSQNKKEKIHLTECLETVKQINLGLLEEINNKGKDQKKAIHPEKEEVNQPEMGNSTMEGEERTELQQVKIKQKAETEHGTQKENKEDTEHDKRTGRTELRDKKNTLCRYYRNCRAGDECQYKHPAVGSNKKEKKDIVDSYKMDKKDVVDSYKMEKKDVICRYHKNCRAGDQCQYKHPEKVKETPNNNQTRRKTEETKNIMCRYYKNCRAGKQCKFKHPETLSNTNQDTGSKNLLEGMQDHLHSLTTQMTKLTRTLSALEKKVRRQEEDSLEKTH